VQGGFTQAKRQSTHSADDSRFSSSLQGVGWFRAWRKTNYREEQEILYFFLFFASSWWVINFLYAYLIE
jgi:hypothetical protein